MHFFFFVRGNFAQVELFKTFAQSQFWKFRRINLKTGKEETKLVQGGLRPTIWGAYEYVFPEEALSEVLAVFGIQEEHCNTFRNKSLRMFFPVEKIPKKNLKEALQISSVISINGHERGLGSLIVDGVHVIPIGIKRDLRAKWKDTGYEQELL